MADNSDKATVYQIEQVDCAKKDVYYRFQYEVSLVQSQAKFEVGLRSHFVYRDSIRELGKPQVYNKSFDSLDEAHKHYTEILADPFKLIKELKWEDSNYYWRYYLDKKAPKATLYSYKRPAELDNGLLVKKLLASSSPKLGTEPHTGEVVRQLWGRAEPHIRQIVLDFARQASLTYGNWSHWKWLYKQAEAANDLELLTSMLGRIDTAKARSEYGPPFSWLACTPSQHTFDYMKRRGRRYLHQLAKGQPAQYVTLAVGILKQTGAGAASLELNSSEWLKFDIMYAGSRRYVQPDSNGRSNYVCRVKRPSLAAHDELVPEAWSAKSEFLLELYSDPTRPWQILEWAYKMLRLRGLPLPVLSDELAIRFLRSRKSPLLIQAAIAQFKLTLLAPRMWLDPKLSALLFFWSKGATRQKLSVKFATPSPELKADWRNTFSNTLYELIITSKSHPRSHKPYILRQTDAARLLVSGYIASLTPEQLITLTPILLLSNDPKLVVSVQNIINTMPFEFLESFLRRCDFVPGVQIEILVEGWLERVRTDTKAKFNQKLAYSLIIVWEKWIRQVAWRLIEASPYFKHPQILTLWDSITKSYPSYQYRHTLSGMVSSTAALRLLLGEENVLAALTAFIFQDNIGIVTLIPDTLAMFLSKWPLANALKLVMQMSDSDWQRLSERLLQELTQDGRIEALWKEVFAALPNDATGRLRQRLLQNAQMQEAFVEVADESFLKTADPDFAPLLLNWLERRPALFGKGSPLLLLAVQSKILEVRQWALQQIERVGLTTPFALRLLESGLPENIAKGKQYFEAVPIGDERELEYILAVCDSPDISVQKYGREYLQKRQAHLPIPEVTFKLAEHPDPLIQELVAANLVTTPIAPEQTQEFDAAVLRRRNKGRRVKEMVKQRLSQTTPTSLDKATLLEMARSRTPRDAEWALQQLVRMVQAGESVEGLEILGASGI